ncbi:MAG: dTDP-4-dehydrorhamnose 3,5-epimerase [Lentisphaerae bacterium GWF2_52_8]|nr:MAG: dTDP-4-dehydrorhamnose 3,5-epimerase [Lentisphaerae bacterium GWF2_52_8]
MKLKTSAIPDVVVLTPKPFEDHRGSFTKLFGFPELHAIMGSRTIRQVNRSITKERGMIRGLHYQNPPFAEMKIVSCLRGKVWDLALDLRKDSETFLQWTAFELSAENRRMIVIPEGFAHGFQALEPESELLYFCTADYVPAAEGGVRFDSPPMNIPWPLKPQGLSERDLAMPEIATGFKGITS